eukprot:3484934-Pleurochrysis_carterae.AAC.2
MQCEKREWRVATTPAHASLRRLDLVASSREDRARSEHQSKSEMDDHARQRTSAEYAQFAGRTCNLHESRMDVSNVPASLSAARRTYARRKAARTDAFIHLAMVAFDADDLGACVSQPSFLCTAALRAHDGCVHKIGNSSEVQQLALRPAAQASLRKRVMKSGYRHRREHSNTSELRSACIEKG